MSTKRLFVVTIEVDTIVIAEDREEAESLAMEQRDDQDGWSSHAVPMSYFPADWEGDSIPFGEADPEAPDRTVDQWIELGAAPEYGKLVAKLAEKPEISK